MLWTNAITEHLLISYRATGQYKEALEMADLYMETKDSLNSQENQKAIIQTQVQSEYEKQKAIDDIENEKRLAIETQKKEKQQILSASIGLGLLLVIILAIGLWHRNRFIKKNEYCISYCKRPC